MLWSGLSLIPFAIAFKWLEGITKPLPVLPMFCAFLFWLIVALMAIWFLYAAWGLACGYSPKAWSNYESSQNEALRQGAISECKRQGIDPPAFLYKDNSKTKGI
jgi:hypothetical protein